MSHDRKLQESIDKRSAAVMQLEAENKRLKAEVDQWRRWAVWALAEYKKVSGGKEFPNAETGV